MRVFIGMPLYSDMACNPLAVKAIFAGSGLEPGWQFTYETMASSLLPKSFNHLWSRGLNSGADYFCMLHGDIVPASGWLQKLLKIIQERDADVVSAIVPIKSNRGLTSGGIGDPQNPWSPLLRFTMKQLKQLPPSFTAAEIGWPGYPLMVNSGCWVANLNREWCRATNEAGELRACFEIHSHVIRDPATQQFVVETESEDWYFSRILHEMGCKVVATELVLMHFGTRLWKSDEEWGDAHDFLANRPNVYEAIRQLEAQGQEPLPRDDGIHDRGFFLDERDDHRFFDPEFAKALVAVCGELQVEDVLDLGCGAGQYVHYLFEHGISARGVDGNPLTPQISGGMCEVADLSQPWITEPAAQAVLSIEVGEHIPAQYSDAFLDNVVNNSRDWVFLSWAHPGAAGSGHINCRPEEYVETQLAARKFVRRKDVECKLQERANLPFLKRIMVYQRSGEPR